MYNNMRIHGCVKKKLTLCERFRLWLLKRRPRVYEKKMDRFLVKAFKDNIKACKYEDLLKKSDEEYYDFIKKMNTKYA